MLVKSSDKMTGNRFRKTNTENRNVKTNLAATISDALNHGE